MMDASVFKAKANAEIVIHTSILEAARDVWKGLRKQEYCMTRNLENSAIKLK